MIYKKTMGLIGTLMTCFTMGVNAQGLAISDLPATSDFQYQIFSNALKNMEIDTLQKWKDEKGFTFPYSKNPSAACNIGMNRSQEKAASINRDPQDQEGTYNRVIVVFEECEKIPLILVSETSIDTFTYGTTVRNVFNKDLKNKDIPKAVKESFKQEMLSELMKQLQPNQWELLMPLIVDQNMDIKVRREALDLFKKLYPERMKNATSYQKAYWEKAKNFNNHSKLVNPRNFDVLISPVNYLHARLVESSLDLSNKLESLSYYKKGVIPVYSEEFWAGKEKRSWDELTKHPKIHKFEKHKHAKLVFNQEIMEGLRQMPEFDWNYQNKFGNTLMHNMFTKEVGVRIDIGETMFNESGANFLKFMLSQNANPMLLNKSKVTPYMYFETYRMKHNKLNSEPLRKVFMMIN